MLVIKDLISNIEMTKQAMTAVFCGVFLLDAKVPRSHARFVGKFRGVNGWLSDVSKEQD